MKARSFILVACMVIVPALAMFSHHLPASRWPLAWGTLSPAAAAPPPGSNAALAPGDRDDVVAPVAETAAADRNVMADRSGSENAPDAAPAGATGSLRFADEAARVAHGRLAALGAMEIECQPAVAGGMAVCSCRVAVDASGQLQRLFQATAPDTATALHVLAEDVTAWRGRAGTR